jgi:hypothetical protein
MYKKISRFFSLLIILISFLWIISSYQLFNNEISSNDKKIQSVENVLPASESKNIIRLELTANMRKYASIDSDIIAIVPGDSEIIILRKDVTSQWFYIALLNSDTVQGWVQAIHVYKCECINNIAILTQTEQLNDELEQKIDTGDLLPDITIYESAIMQSNKIILTLANLGKKSLYESTFSIKITKVNGEIVGIVQFGPSDIEKQKYTTIILPIVLKESGLHIIHVDYLNEIQELNEENNIISNVYTINDID